MVIEPDDFSVEASKENIHKTWYHIGPRKSFKGVDITQCWDYGHAGFEPHLYSSLFVKL